MNMFPDSWGIGQSFVILPVNLLNNEFTKAYLGGMTCDPDDRYFINEKNVVFDFPIINEGEDLYIAVFNIGAYQEMISGIGGVHHCLIPESNELVIYKDKDGNIKEMILNDAQTIEKMLDRLDYDKDSYISNFIDD